MGSILKRTVRAVRIAATDKRIPRPLRWLAALGLAPIPGPFDEALLLIVGVPLALAGAWVVLFAGQLGRMPLLPVNDPYFKHMLANPHQGGH